MIEVRARRQGDADPTSARRHAVARVRRNFWLLVAATVVAVGVLSQTLREPAGPATGIVVAVAGLAAITSLTLAGRILTVTTARRASLGSRTRRSPRRR